MDATETIILGGGLDELSSDFDARPGSVRRSLNYAAVTGGGYRQVGGYRRWSGRDPTVRMDALAVVEAVRMEGRYTIPRAVSESGVAARYVGKVQRESTSLILLEREAPTAQYQPGESWATGTVDRSILDPNPELRPGEAEAIEAAVIEFGRGFGTQPPGTGAIVLLAAHAGSAWCVRMDGRTAVVSRAIRAGTGGWVEVGRADMPGSRDPERVEWRAASHQFPGRERELFIANGMGPGLRISPSGSGSGHDIVELDPGTAVPPINVTVHREHLFLAFPNGSIITSGIGDPTSFDPVSGGAAELSVSEAITGWHQLPGDSLAITGLSRTTILSGTSAADWRLDVHSDEAGALSGTHANLPTAIHADRRGITTLSATDAYGNFASAALSRAFDPTFQRITSGSRLHAVVHRSRSEYRLIAETGRALYLTFDGRSLVGAMEVDFGQPVTAAVALDGDSEYGELASIETKPHDPDTVLIATADGWVNVLDADDAMPGPGRPFIETPDYHYRAPSQRKRFKRADVELTGDPRTEMEVTSIIDGGDEWHEDSDPVDVEMSYRKRPLYRSDLLQRFDQSFSGTAYLVGTGLSQALRVEATSDHPHTIRSIEVHMTRRGQRR